MITIGVRDASPPDSPESTNRGTGAPHQSDEGSRQQPEDDVVAASQQRLELSAPRRQVHREVMSRGGQRAADEVGVHQ